MTKAEAQVIRTAKRLARTWWKYRKFLSEGNRSDLFRDIASLDVAVGRLKRRTRCAE